MKLNEIITDYKIKECSKKDAYAAVKATPEWIAYEESNKEFKQIESVYKTNLQNIETNTELDNYKISVSLSVTKKFNIEKFKEENPEMWEKYLEDEISWKRTVRGK